MIAYYVMKGVLIPGLLIRKSWLIFLASSVVLLVAINFYYYYGLYYALGLMEPLPDAKAFVMSFYTLIALMIIFGVENFLSKVNNDGDPTSIEKGQRAEFNDEYFFVKTQGVYQRIEFANILFIKGFQNYVKIRCSKEEYIVYLTLRQIMDRLKEADFLRIHRSYIVNRRNVDRIDGNEIFMTNGDSIPFNRKKREEIFKVLLEDKLVVR